jgi:hypothetical protein
MDGTETYHRAVELLRQGITSNGFVASTGSRANYHRIWARDSVITGMGALLTDEKELIEGMRKTLTALKTNQHNNGMIPSNLETDTTGKVKKVSYGTLTGKVDAGLWFVIGVFLYFKKTKDRNFIKEMQRAVKQVFKMLAIWEFNGRGLLYVPQGGSWADEFVLEGYNLSEQLLYYWALEEASRVYASKLYVEKARILKELIMVNYWPFEKNKGKAYHKTAFIHQLVNGTTNHWMAGFKPSGYFTYFDCLAHALTFILGINQKSQKQKITTLIETIASGLKDFLVPAFLPVIKNMDAEWNSLQNNWTYQFRNMSGEYQNGGVWPVFNGLLIAGLYKSNERELAGKLRQALYRAVAMPDNQYGFYEYLNANNWSPDGAKHQLWSAAGVIFAENAAQNIFLA